jgi:TonB family protein
MMEGARKAASELKSKNMTEDLDRMVDSQGRRLKQRNKDIRFKMLIRRKDDPEISPEYEWSTKPKIKGFAPQVVYPFALLVENTSGKATVRFRINHQGRVDLATVLEASKPEFGKAAQAAIETMVFTPAKKKDGSPALVLCDADFNFIPDGTGDVQVSALARNLLKASKAGADNVVTPAELDTPLRPANTPSPAYPVALVKAGKSGTATIEFIVDEEGWVELPRVVGATAEEFGFAAAQAVATWQFNPPTKKGRPAVTRARIEIEFTPTANQTK